MRSTPGWSGTRAGCGRPRHWQATDLAPRMRAVHSPVRSARSRSPMSERLHSGRLIATVSEVVDAGFELLPHFELAAIPVLDGAERPGEEPAVRRRLRAEGIRAGEHRG